MPIGTINNKKNQLKVEILISKAFNLDLAIFSGTGTQGKLAMHMSWYLLYKKYGMSNKEIGDLYIKDYTTVIRGVKKIENLDVKEKLDEIVKAKTKLDVIHNTKK